MDYFEILFHKKYGSSVPIDGKFYEALFAVAGEREETTIVGVPPIIFLAKGDPLSDYFISGNTVQDGTPSPEAPIDVLGCGERTGNLYDYRKLVPGYTYDTDGQMILNPNISDREKYAAVPLIEVEPGATYLRTYNLAPWGNIINFYDSNKNFLEHRQAGTGHAVTVPSNCNFVSFVFQTEGVDVEKYMFTKGSTAPKSYIPYGYKLPLTVNGTEYPIYLGQVPTTRKNRKLVLTGEENWVETTAALGAYRFYLQLNDSVQSDTSIGAKSACTHFALTTTGNTYSQNNCYTIAADNKLFISKDSDTRLAAFKQWLATQYQNGTPVIIWYVLATPETGIVNEPLHKIGDYADTISMAQAGVTIPTVAGANTLTIDTTVQPSSVTIRGRIRPTL